MAKAKKATPKKVKKKLVSRYKVTIKEQYKEFDSQNEAIEWAKKLLNAPIYFLNMIRIEVEE